jgi:hypothetical protein
MKHILTRSVGKDNFSGQNVFLANGAKRLFQGIDLFLALELKKKIHALEK